MRVDRLAGGRIDRQLRRVEQGRRVAGHLQDVAGQAREPLAGVDRVLVLVGLLGVEDFGARLRVRAVGGPGREQFAVVRFVVVDAGGAGVAAGDLGDDARDGVGGDGRLGVGELDAVADQGGERRVRVLADVPLEVGLVEAVDREQQDVFGVLFGGTGRDGRADWSGADLE